VFDFWLCLFFFIVCLFFVNWRFVSFYLLWDWLVGFLVCRFFLMIFSCLSFWLSSLWRCLGFSVVVLCLFLGVFVLRFCCVLGGCVSLNLIIWIGFMFIVVDWITVFFQLV